MYISKKVSEVLVRKKIVFVSIFLVLFALTLLSFRSSGNYWMGGSTLQLSVFYSKNRGAEVIIPIESLISRFSLKYDGVQFSKVSDSILKIQNINEDQGMGLKALEDVTDEMLKEDKAYSAKLVQMNDIVLLREAEVLSNPKIKGLRPVYMKKETILLSLLTFLVLFTLSSGLYILLELNKQTEK